MNVRIGAGNGEGFYPCPILDNRKSIFREIITDIAPAFCLNGEHDGGPLYRDASEVQRRLRAQ